MVKDVYLDFSFKNCIASARVIFEYSNRVIDLASDPMCD